MSCLVIVGAGFCGSMTAVQVLRHARFGSAIKRLILVEQSGRFSSGLAYSTPMMDHLLNVPAGRMSAFDDQPEHFLEWCRHRDPSITGSSFVPRRLYGHYLSSILRLALESNRQSADPIQVECLDARAVAVNIFGFSDSTNRDDRRSVAWNVGLDRHSDLMCDQIVLAVGNFSPAFPGGLGLQQRMQAHPGFCCDPWILDGPQSVLDVPREADVFMIGTGLTMIDLAIAFDRVGHRGVIYAISRHGLLPQAHRDSAVPPAPYLRPVDLDSWPRTARGLLRALRAEVERASEIGIDWREVVTAVRHDTSMLWQRMSMTEKQRFLTHLRAYWETHRHRAAPVAAAVIDRMIGSGRLRIISGRILDIKPCSLSSMAEDSVPGRHEGGLEVEYRPRGGDASRHIRVAKVINCTGPDSDLRRVADPLIVSLREAGHLRPDLLGLGVDTDPAGRAVDVAGSVVPGLYVVGPLRKGGLWENTAVPELRGETLRLARTIIEDAPRCSSICSQLADSAKTRV